MRLVELGDNEFIQFKELIYNEAGIKLSDLKKALVQSRLSKRLRALRLSSYEDYYTYLIDNYTTEKINFINAITTNKTDFFRESKHFDFLKNIYLPELVRLNKKSIKIWSAGCSSGEEPYSIAITLNEFYKNSKDVDLKILATDIDTGVLETAGNGVYISDKVEEIDIELLRKYFYRGINENEGFFKVKDTLRDIISFRRLNLLLDSYPMKGKFDAIFCRNVIIYFDKPTQARLFENLYHHLDDHGYLFIGHSENITSITNRFTLVGHTIYKKAIT